MDLLIGTWLVVMLLVSFVGWATLGWWIHERYFKPKSADPSAIKLLYLEQTLVDVRAQHDQLKQEHTKLMALLIDRLLREA